MDLKTLREHGGFVPLEPVQREVTWTPPEGDPVTFTVLVRTLSGADREILRGKLTKETSVAALVVSEGILLGEGGKERLTYAQACGLQIELLGALVEAFESVNPFSRKAADAAKN